MIQLDEAAIDKAMPLVATGLEKYCFIRDRLFAVDVASDRPLQCKFNGFYRVRRNSAWQTDFYAILQQQKSSPKPFDQVLHNLYVATGRIEASFASKLVGSVDPSQPVIDAIVLNNLRLRISRVGTVEARLARIAEIHNEIHRLFADYLGSEVGGYLINRFERAYPGRQLTPVKMLDLVLWQTR